MKRFLSILLALTLICTTIVVPAVSVMAEETATYEDYVAEDTTPVNIYANDSGLTGRWLSTFDAIHPAHSGGIEGAMRYRMVANPGYWGDSSATPVAGGDMTLCLDGYQWKADTTYIFSTRLQNHKDSGISESRFIYMIDSRDGTNTSKPYEMLTITKSGEWQDFRFKLHVEVDGTSKSNLHYGYPNHSSLHNPQGTDILFQIGSLIIEEEVGRSIEIAGEDTVVTEGGEALTFTSKIYNQYDEEITNIKETSQWYVVNEDRTQKVDGFDITVSDDGLSAQISVSKNAVPGGNYVLMTENNSTGTENFRKGIDITVQPRYANDNGDMVMRAKLNKDDAQWTTDKISTGLVDSILVEASLTGNTEAFDWYVADADRVSVVEGIDITVSREGEKETATVVPAPSFPEGDYYVIAEAQDGSIKGQPININKAADILSIKDTFTSDNASDIKEGLEGIYLSILEIPDGFASKADADALSKVIAGSAEKENIADASLSELQEIVERLALVSIYNVGVQDVALYDENGHFNYADKLAIADADGVTLMANFENYLDTENKVKLQNALMGKGYKNHADFAEDAKELMLLYTLAYPNVNGVEYVSELLTEANLTELGIDAENYLALEEPILFNDEIAGELFTFEKFKALVEDAEDPQEDEEDSSSSSSSGRGSGGGGGFSVGTSKKNDEEDNKEENKIEPQTYSFKDVPKTHWAYSDIHYLKSIGVIDGIDAENFAPEAEITREQFLKLIVAAFNVKMQASGKKFDDVDSSAWYAPYVAAGVENGIITGTSETTFGTGLAITRQDACTIIARALGFDVEPDGDISFTDAEEIAPYAKSSVAALSGYAIINGFEDGSFGPAKVCTRSQAAKIIATAIGIANAVNVQ